MDLGITCAGHQPWTEDKDSTLKHLAAVRQKIDPGAFTWDMFGVYGKCNFAWSLATWHERYFCETANLKLCIEKHHPSDNYFQNPTFACILLSTTAHYARHLHLRSAKSLENQTATKKPGHFPTSRPRRLVAHPPKHAARSPQQ